MDFDRQFAVTGAGARSGLTTASIQIAVAELFRALIMTTSAPMQLFDAGRWKSSQYSRRAMNRHNQALTSFCDL